MARKPRIEVREVSMFGDFSEEELQNPARDRFYLPGWSDKRAEFERAKVEYEQGHGDMPKPLPRRFQFVSVERPSGAPDGTKMANFAGDGYRPVKWTEAKDLGLDLGDAETGYTSACRPDAEGNVRVGSQILTVTDARRAATNLERQRRAQLAQTDEIVARMDRTAAEVNRRMGLPAESGTAFELVQTDEPVDDPQQGRGRKRGR